MRLGLINLPEIETNDSIYKPLFQKLSDPDGNFTNNTHYLKDSN